MNPTGPLATIEDFIEEPEALAARLRESPRPVLGAVCFLLGALSLFLSNGLSGRLFLLGPSPAALVLLSFWHLGTGAAMSAISHLLAEALGGRGRAITLFVLFGLSDLAWTALLPLTLLWLAVFPNARWATGLITVLVSYWVLWLKARSIGHNYAIPLGKAWTALCLPYAAVVLAALALFSMTVLGLLRHALKLAA